MKIFRSGWILLIFFLILSGCSAFKTKPQSYPKGVMFPVKKEFSLSFEGEVIRNIHQEEEHLFFSTYSGKIYCVDLKSREIIWTFDALTSDLTECDFGKTMIYFISGEMTLKAIDRNGKEAWSFKSDSPITSRIAENDGQVYFGTDKGSLVSLSVLNGEKIWQIETRGTIRSNLVIVNSQVIFGSDDGEIFIVDTKGSIVNSFQISHPITRGLLADSQNLYIFSKSPDLTCYDLIRNKIKWRIRLNGYVPEPPLISKKKIFFVTWNGLLYCLDKRRGDILWWKNLPSRSSYEIESMEDKIVVSSLSSRLECYDMEKGERVGFYLAKGDIRSNPVWFDSWIVIALFELNKNEGELAFLSKVLRVRLESSKTSPQRPNEEIIFTAAPDGFFQPEFEFYISHEGTREIVQDRSELNSLSWFPAEEGEYTVGVVVTDEKASIDKNVEYRIMGIDKVIKHLQDVLPISLNGCWWL